MRRHCLLSEPHLLKGPHGRLLLRLGQFCVCALLGGGPGLCCSAGAASSTRNATHLDGRLQKSSVRVKNGLWARANSVVRPDVLRAAADIYLTKEKYDALAECEQALARDCFQIFAGFQGATMLDSVGHAFSWWIQHDTCWEPQKTIHLAVLFGLILEPWGAKCIFERGAPAFKLCWASNPGAMTHLLACWIEHSALAPKMQVAMLGITDCVFRYLDWGALHLKQMLAAEVMRLEAESDDKSVQLSVSEISKEFPEIRALQWAIKRRDKKIPKKVCLFAPLPWQDVIVFLQYQRAGPLGTVVWICLNQIIMTITDHICSQIAAKPIQKFTECESTLILRGSRILFTFRMHFRQHFGSATFIQHHAEIPTPGSVLSDGLHIF